MVTVKEIWCWRSDNPHRPSQTKNRHRYAMIFPIAKLPWSRLRFIDILGSVRHEVLQTGALALQSLDDNAQ
ncbi:hypothetical protein [Herbaspirillum frisingense]|uniref:hypothetical protein n=1 Tax=Herbaspirillum frisingense TaxID=92645 RepID=UPI001268DA63|nr:hypothetical protein [Herbaspirillum frisingense]